MNILLKTTDKLSQEIELIKRLPIVPTILEVICNTTGMGFAAVARVTPDRWIACSIRDEIQFGLKPGGELQIETTICDEIRDSRQPVIIDHVETDSRYCNHHTPRLYGFQSYISIPIILKNGDFFGTLCAIDPNPKSLNNSRTLGLFNLFADLISFHLHSQDLVQQSDRAIKEISQHLTDTVDENRQYKYISSHNLQEPLRKIRLFSSMLVDASAKHETEKTKDLALKVTACAQRFSMMIKEISEFSDINYELKPIAPLDLNEIVSDVLSQLNQPIIERGASIEVGKLPVIKGIPSHIEQVFFHLINNALKYATPDGSPLIRIYSEKLTPDQARQLSPTERGNYHVIHVEDNGIGIQKSELEKIFHIFTRLTTQPALGGFGVGLAYCRKVIRLHGGFISATSEPGEGTTFSITIPADKVA